MKKIPLSKGKFAIVDDDDFEYLSKFKWYYVFKKRSRNGYAVRDFSRNIEIIKEFGVSHVTMHRFIIKPSRNKLVDHVNGDGLDNRKSNLRECTHTQNNGNFLLGSRNRSGYKGVSWHKTTKKWRASLMTKEKQIYLGLFINPKDAAAAYNREAIKYFGDFARINQL